MHPQMLYFVNVLCGKRSPDLASNANLRVVLLQDLFDGKR